MATRRDAVVIGAGPNGLAAAITLARAGRSVTVYEAAPTPGGGCRSAALTEPGFVHDVCAAVHALGITSPFFVEHAAELATHGLRWVQPLVPLAHPLDGGRAVVATQPIDGTVATLDDDDARRYLFLLAPLVRNFDALAPSLLGPLLRVPRHPLALARFGLPALAPASLVAGALGEAAGALFAGCAAHAILPLERPLTASFGLLLLASAHAGGWPVALGGSQRVIDAMVSYLRSLGGEVVCDHPVRDLRDLEPSRVVLADTSPGALADIAGDALPAGFVRRARAFRHGPGVCKVDYALDGPVPWTNPACRDAGTLHLGGTAAEIASAEHAMWHGRHADRPYVLVAQPSVCDPTRAPAGKHVLWAYCHVPSGSDLDRSEAIERQIERFAPGFRDLVRARHVMTAVDYARYNANDVGGDIAGGAHSGRQLLLRGPLLRPYRTGAEEVLLCSASTPPGAGVHGMCGVHAAQLALRTTLR